MQHVHSTAHIGAQRIQDKNGRRVPRAGMSKRGALILFVLWAGIVLAAVTHIYPDGFWVSLPFGHWCGYEFSPNPGAFCDVS